MLHSGDLASAEAMLTLLDVTFAQSMTYNQSLNLTYVLPKAILEFHPERRSWQIEALADVVAVNFLLAEPFLNGMQRGLDLLAQNQLNRFVAQGMEKYARDEILGAKFLALESKLGLDICQAMQVIVPLSQVQAQLNRYLKARTGLAVTTRPISELSHAAMNSDITPCACSDGRFIYLADEMRHYPEKDANRRLYKHMVRLEVGYYEFDTFTFDLEKALERIDIGRTDAGQQITPMPKNRAGIAQAGDQNASDLERFFQLFPQFDLAADLFMIYEHGRLRNNHIQRYPGLARQVYPLYQQEVLQMLHSERLNSQLLDLYAWIALGMPPEGFAESIAAAESVFASIGALFEARMQPGAPVEVSAELVWLTYADIMDLLGQTAAINAGNGYQPLKLPFGRCLRPDLFHGTFRSYETLAANLKKRIEARGLKIYKADVTQHLLNNDGRISLDDLEALIIQPPASHDDVDFSPDRQPVDLAWLDLGDFLECDGIGDLAAADANGATFRYEEWDCRLADYLDDHVQVIERPVETADKDFYDLTLQQYSGLVKQIRRAFELLKPEGYKVLRQWLEGDDFDYRALIDYAVERKAHRIPSERLYIKRVKAQRDVAALLLVDLSRSTANRAHGTKSKVIDIEKEAIVLLCEALEVVGDTYAIAGFSGTGRLGVDYFRIKDFNEPLDDQVRGRIHAMTPHRSTRMGAAIRHATGILAEVPAKVRLLIVLGDGFPNDVDYKKKYAIEDTSKAIYEARARHIHVKGITVNIAGDGRLDAVYGNFHHSIISDVRELPDKLLRIYGTVTR